MSFSKSKVERFPCPKGIRTPIKEGIGPRPEILQERKRLCMHSKLSSSMMSTSCSSFLFTPPKKDSTKRKFASLEESKCPKISKSNSTGSKKKAPVERIPTLYLSRNKAVISKPHNNSPIYRGSLFKGRMSQKKETPPIKRKQLLTTSGSKKAATPEVKDDMPTAKRKKLDETCDEIYSTPLTSPPRSADCDKNNSDSSILINIQPESVEETNFKMPDDTEKQELLTPTTTFESTRLLDKTSIPFATLACEITTVDLPMNSDPDENTDNSEDSDSNSDSKEATVTTLCRNPVRKSFARQSSSTHMEGSYHSSGSFNLFEHVLHAPMESVNFPIPDDEHTSRNAPASLWGNNFFDVDNDAFIMQLSLQQEDTGHNSRLRQAPTNSDMWTYAEFDYRPSATFSANADGARTIARDFPPNRRRTRIQSFSSYNRNPDLAAESVENLPAPPVVQPLSIQDRIGRLFSGLFFKRTRRENFSRTISSTAGLNGIADYNYTLALGREEINLRQGSEPRNASITCRALFYAETIKNVRSREMRRFMRMIRVEARRTLTEVEACLIVPAKLYIKSPNFWMPVLEFVAGQAVEISLASLKV